MFGRRIVDFDVDAHRTQLLLHRDLGVLPDDDAGHRAQLDLEPFAVLHADAVTPGTQPAASSSARAAAGSYGLGSG